MVDLRSVARNTARPPKNLTNSISRNLKAKSRVTLNEPLIPLCTHSVICSVSARTQVSTESSDGTNDDSIDVAGKQIVRKTRNSRPAAAARPNQLRFYTGSWIDILTNAKNWYRLKLHCVLMNPFPERSAATLNEAHKCILDAVGCHLEEESNELEDSVFLFILFLRSC